MSQLISSIDPVIAFYIGIGIVGLIVTIVADKMHMPDSEYRRRYGRRHS